MVEADDLQPGRHRLPLETQHSVGVDEILVMVIVGFVRQRDQRADLEIVTVSQTDQGAAAFGRRRRAGLPPQPGKDPGRYRN